MHRRQCSRMSRHSASLAALQVAPVLWRLVPSRRASALRKHTVATHLIPLGVLDRLAWLCTVWAAYPNRAEPAPWWPHRRAANFVHSASLTALPRFANISECCPVAMTRDSSNLQRSQISRTIPRQSQLLTVTIFRGFIPVAVNSDRRAAWRRQISRTTVRPCLPCTTCKSGAEFPVLVGAISSPHSPTGNEYHPDICCPSINGANYTWGAAAQKPAIFTALPS